MRVIGYENFLPTRISRLLIASRVGFSLLVSRSSSKRGESLQVGSTHFMKMTAVDKPIQPRMINHGGTIDLLEGVPRGTLTRVGVGDEEAEELNGTFDSIDERRLETGEGL